ncbi:hypothetical protein QAD02_011328 [Eretmocerus hayati]|uniref:Uncharacterized protein n=1 Tax=Eretmocerus hayati TaxID=131215 RepID=A0ACC2NWR6_9HYME|nr:hypothetical protein QAD02_011328 [Eretmocerus hayati]
MGCGLSCSKKHYTSHFDEAKSSLDKFVELAPQRELYGLRIMVNNMFNISYMAHDVKLMDNPVNDISAFCFENLLGKLKEYSKVAPEHSLHSEIKLKFMVIVEVRDQMCLETFSHIPALKKSRWNSEPRGDCVQRECSGKQKAQRYHST